MVPTETRSGSAQGQRRGAEVGARRQPQVVRQVSGKREVPGGGSASLVVLAAEIQALGVRATSEGAQAGSEVAVIIDAVRTLQTQIQECRAEQGATTQRMLHLEAENAGLRQQVRQRPPSPEQLRDAPLGRSSQSASSTDPAPPEAHRSGPEGSLARPSSASSGSRYRTESAEAMLKGDDHEDRSQEILQRLAAVQEVQTKLLAKFDNDATAHKDRQLSPDAAAGIAGRSEADAVQGTSPLVVQRLSTVSASSPVTATRAARSSTAGSASLMLSADSKLVDPSSAAEARGMRRGMSFDIAGVSASSFVEEDRAAGVASTQERGPCRRPTAVSVTAPPRIGVPTPGRPVGSPQVPTASSSKASLSPPPQARPRSGALEKARLWAQERRNSAKVMAAAQAAFLQEDIEAGETTAVKSDEETGVYANSSEPPVEAPQPDGCQEIFAAAANAVPTPVKPTLGRPDEEEWEAMIHAKAPLNFSPTLETSLDAGLEFNTAARSSLPSSSRVMPGPRLQK